MQLDGRPLPTLCLLRSTTGIRCPGCGLTRSVVELGHGNPRQSLQNHKLGWLVLLYVLIQALRHLTWLALPRAREWLATPGRWLDRSIVALAALLLVAWIPTLAQDLGPFFH